MSGKVINLATELEACLPAELVHFMMMAGKVARVQEQNLYIVGGVVRDLLLRKANLDLDLVVEGDAIRLAGELARGKQVKLTTHARFNTTSLEWEKWRVDIATARSETYARPGALPAVRPDSIKKDLCRRDFTVNAMAIYLNPDRYGELIDLYGGVNDLERKLIRVLHDKSFIDDATRIWRAIRYEQRLGFSIEPATLALLRRDISMLDTISGDRIRNELELVLKEAYPEKTLGRARELGVLKKIHPSLKADHALVKYLMAAREGTYPRPVSLALSFALLTCHLSKKEVEEVVSYLKIPKAIAQVMRDAVSIMGTEPKLAKERIAPSRIYQLLHGYTPAALAAVSIATGSAAVRANINLYLNKLRYIKTSLNGNDLIRLGITEGPSIKEVLQRLLDARLDGRVTGRKGEEAMVEQWKNVETHG